MNRLDEQNLPGLLACKVVPDVTCTAAHTKSNTGLQKGETEMILPPPPLLHTAIIPTQQNI
jgi:hypothetical protein